MKHLTALLTLLLVCSWAPRIRAQSLDSWENVSPAGEQFTILMPKGHVVKSQKNTFDQLTVATRIYTVTGDSVVYTVWSLVNEGYANNGPTDDEAYLDACADLVWLDLLKPLRDQLPKSAEVLSKMSYQGELESSRLPPGREYTITLGYQPGLTHIHVAGQHIYVLTVLNADANSVATQRFINSFDLKLTGLPAAATLQADPKVTPPVMPIARAGQGVGTGVGTGRDPGGTNSGGGIGTGVAGNMGGGDRKVVGGGPATGPADSTDYSRIFSPRELTQKARVFSKPEPSYTESARRYSVQGTVVIRAVFSRSGEVTNMRVVRGLPHGLIQRALGAARLIRFTPALKDGHEVSMYIQLEYNFNLY